MINQIYLRMCAITRGMVDLEHLLHCFKNKTIHICARNYQIHIHVSKTCGSNHRINNVSKYDN